jgi:hypothetical protein
MRFCVESNLMTDDGGRAIANDDERRLRYTMTEAANAAEAIRAVVGNDGIEVDRVSHVGETQAMATVRRGRSAMMMHAYPEEEIDWRAPGARKKALRR